MRNLILQHWDSNELGELEQLSVENIMTYACTVGAKYQMIKGKPLGYSFTSPCHKVYMLSPEFDEYDTVVMMDTDMFIRKGMTDNIFEATGCGRHYDIQETLVRNLNRRFPLLSDINRPYWG